MQTTVAQWQLLASLRRWSCNSTTTIDYNHRLQPSSTTIDFNLRIQPSTSTTDFNYRLQRSTHRWRWASAARESAEIHWIRLLSHIDLRHECSTGRLEVDHRKIAAKFSRETMCPTYWSATVRKWLLLRRLLLSGNPAMIVPKLTVALSDRSPAFG